MEQSESYLRRILDGSRSVTIVVDISGIVRYASHGIGRIVGVPAEQLAEASVFDWLHPEDVDRAATSLAVSAEVGPLRYFPMTFRLVTVDGEEVEVDVLAANHLDDPEVAGIVLDLRRADERSPFFDPVRALATGASHAEVLELIASGLGRGGEVLRPAFMASERDPATGRYAQLHAVRAPAGLVATVRSLLHLPGPWQELATGQLASVAIEELTPELTADLRSDGYAGLRVGAIGVLGEVGALLLSAEPEAVWHSGRWSPSMESHWHQLLDLGTVAFERHRYQSRLVHAATHDPLTGLANRARFFEELGRMARRSDVAVLYLDLDGFKAVNDALGHARGDDVLVEVGQRLQATVRPGDLIARLGGDEFAVAVGAPEPAHVAHLADRLAVAVTTRLLDDEPVEPIGVSIGVCHRRPGQSVDDLVRCADNALLTAKRLGRGRVVVSQ